MSEKERPIVIDFSSVRADDEKRDQNFEQDSLPVIKDDIQRVLALANTPEDAKASVRQVLLDNLDGRQFTDPTIVWNIEKSKIFITAEVQILVFDAQGNSRQIKVVVQQVNEFRKTGKRTALLSKYIN